MPCVSVRDQLRVTAVFPTTTTTKMTAGKEVSILEIISSDREILCIGFESIFTNIAISLSISHIEFNKSIHIENIFGVFFHEQI